MFGDRFCSNLGIKDKFGICPEISVDGAGSIFVVDRSTKLLTFPRTAQIIELMFPYGRRQDFVIGEEDRPVWFKHGPEAVLA